MRGACVLGLFCDSGEVKGCMDSANEGMAIVAMIYLIGFACGDERPSLQYISLEKKRQRLRAQPRKPTQ